MRLIPSLLFLALAGCGEAGTQLNFPVKQATSPKIVNNSPYLSKEFEKGSWQYFLQQLPIVDSPVVDYTGKRVRQQYKSAGVIPYDVGQSDLQQCADALMRIRAEYLFGQKDYDRIAFHFVSGQLYSFNDYCKGEKPVPDGNNVKFIQGSAAEINHSSLRKYLDLVYTYASTISLAKELNSTSDFEVGTVVIHAGSPGHCFMIIDEKQNTEGKKVFKLAEGYTPAQSIYVLKNSDGTCWHELAKGQIETASYSFLSYELKKFE
jgi:hypothetical protein